VNPVSVQVYQLFLSELQRNLAQVHADLMEGDAPTPAEAREIGRTFHTIRGGAGFLGFDLVASRAAELDHLLRKSADEIELNLGRVREVLGELESLAASLPESPTSEPPGA
jgi:chemotaxis protein histidine kinase CheA